MGRWIETQVGPAPLEPLSRLSGRGGRSRCRRSRRRAARRRKLLGHHLPDEPVEGSDPASRLGATEDARAPSASAADVERGQVGERASPVGVRKSPSASPEMPMCRRDTNFGCTPHPSRARTPAARARRATRKITLGTRSAVATGSAVSSTSTTEPPPELRHEQWRPSRVTISASVSFRRPFPGRAGSRSSAVQ